MCRNIRVLFNFQPPTTDDEIRAAALQYVRKVSGSAKPSKANEAIFDKAVEAISAITAEVVYGMTTTQPPRTREQELAKARERNRKRFGVAPA